MKLKSKKQEPVEPQKSSSKSAVGSLSTPGTERVYTELDSEGRLVSRPLTTYECKLEDDVEQLQDALFTISSHYAKIQFRLRQIASASTCERNFLLEELERMTTQGLDGCNTNQVEELPSLKCDSLSLGNVRYKQHKIISQLRERLQDLAQAAGACFEADYKDCGGVGDGPEYVDQLDSVQQIELCEDKKEAGGQYLQEAWSDTDYGNEELRWPISKPRRSKNKNGNPKGPSRRGSNISNEIQTNKKSEKLKQKSSKKALANQDPKINSPRNKQPNLTPPIAARKFQSNVVKRLSKNIFNSFNGSPKMGITPGSSHSKNRSPTFSPLRRTQSHSQYSNSAKSRNSLTTPLRYSDATSRGLTNSVIQRSGGAINGFSGSRSMTLHPSLRQTQSTMPSLSLSNGRMSVETGELTQSVGRSSDRKIRKWKYKEVSISPSQSDDFSEKIERNTIYREGTQQSNSHCSWPQKNSQSNTSESYKTSLKNICKSCPWKFNNGIENTELSECSDA